MLVMIWCVWVALEPKARPENWRSTNEQKAKTEEKWNDFNQKKIGQRIEDPLEKSLQNRQYKMVPLEKVIFLAQKRAISQFQLFME